MKKIVDFLRPKANLEDVLARMAAKDGLNFRQIAKSTVIHKGMAARGFDNIPKTINTVVASVK